METSALREAQERVEKSESLYAANLAGIAMIFCSWLVAAHFAMEKPLVWAIPACVSVVLGYAMVTLDRSRGAALATYKRLLEEAYLRKRFRTPAGAEGIVLRVSRYGTATLAFPSGVQQEYRYSDLEPVDEGSVAA